MARHYEADNGKVACGVDARYRATDWAEVDCQRCQKTRKLPTLEELRQSLADAVKVLDADGVVYGDTGDDTEPLDVLRTARALLARMEGR